MGLCDRRRDQVLWRFLPHTVTAASCICTASSLSYRAQPLPHLGSAPQGLQLQLAVMHQASFPELTLGSIFHVLCEMEEKVILETSDHLDLLKIKWCLHKPSKPLKKTCKKETQKQDEIGMRKKKWCFQTKYSKEEDLKILKSFLAFSLPSSITYISSLFFPLYRTCLSSSVWSKLLANSTYLHH